MAINNGIINDYIVINNYRNNSTSNKNKENESCKRNKI